MSEPATIKRIACLATTGLILGGCGASLSTAGIKTASPATTPLAGMPSSYAGTPAAIYTLLARGLNGCWLAPGRHLHSSHLLRARVSSKHETGGASIVIYERASAGKTNKLTAAMRINIAPASPGRSTIDVINRRISLPQAQQIRSDVQRWARADLTCSSTLASTGQDSPANSARSQKKLKPKKKK